MGGWEQQQMGGKGKRGIGRLGKLLALCASRLVLFYSMSSVCSSDQRCRLVAIQVSGTPDLLMTEAYLVP